MNYIPLFSEDELDIILGIIGGDSFKWLFKKFPKEFNKIKPGFQAKSLSETAAVSTAKRNINSHFIQFFVNKSINDFVNDISNCVSEKEKSGICHDDALAETLIDSVFSDFIHVYFKCINEEITEEHLVALKNKINTLKNERVKDSETEKKVTELESAITDLQKKLEQTQQELTETCSSKDKEIFALEKQLSEAQEKIKQLEFSSTLNESEIVDNDLLLEYDDSKFMTLPLIPDDNYVSLCFVSNSYDGERWLIRCADIDQNGNLEAFHKNDEIPYLFANRDKLFHKDGPACDGVFGVWDWSAVARNSDPSKDYVITKYNPNILPIEVVIFSEFHSIDELINELKDGILYQPKSNRIIFAVNRTNDRCEGVLCNKKDLQITSESIIFSELIALIPVYEFSCNDVINVKDNILFYKKLAAGIPKKIYRIKTQMEIVKDTVLNSISWTNYKQRGILKSEYKIFKEFLTSLPIEDINKKICVACRCGSQTASQLLQQFIDNLFEYVDEKSFDDSVIVTAISGNAALMDKAKTLVAEDWKKENSYITAKAQEEINKLNTQIEEANKILSNANHELAQVKQEDATLSAMISEKEKLAANVETAVSDRIKKAQENAADFIANMAFVGGSLLNINSVSKQGAKYEVIQYDTISDNLEPHKNWSEVIDTVVYELEEAGVSSKHSRGLSAYLCAAFIEKQPILLVGPNAMDIVEAFSFSLFGGKYGVLNCDENYSQDLINIIGDENERIIAIKNFTASGWMNNLPYIVSREDTMFFVIHPYDEDIQVEPKSLYSYMLPLFTGFFVERSANRKYIFKRSENSLGITNVFDHKKQNI